MEGNKSKSIIKKYAHLAGVHSLIYEELPDFPESHKMCKSQVIYTKLEKLENGAIFHTGSRLSTRGLIQPSSVFLNFGCKLESFEDKKILSEDSLESSGWGTVDFSSESVYISSLGSEPCSSQYKPGPAMDLRQKSFRVPAEVLGTRAEMDYLKQLKISSFKESALSKVFYTSHLTHYWKKALINWFLWSQETNSIHDTKASWGSSPKARHLIS